MLKSKRLDALLLALYVVSALIVGIRDLPPETSLKDIDANLLGYILVHGLFGVTSWIWDFIEADIMLLLLFVGGPLFLLYLGRKDSKPTGSKVNDSMLSRQDQSEVGATQHGFSNPAVTVHRCQITNQNVKEDGTMDDLEIQRKLSDRDLQIFNAEFQRNQKSTGVAYLLFILLAAVGAHQWYLGHTKKAIAYIISFILVVVGSMMSSIGFVGGMIAETDEEMEAAVGSGALGLILLVIFGIILGLMWIYDLFTLGRKVDRRNQQIKKELLARMTGTAGEQQAAVTRE